MSSSVGVGSAGGGGTDIASLLEKAKELDQLKKDQDDIVVEINKIHKKVLASPEMVDKSVDAILLKLRGLYARAKELSENEISASNALIGLLDGLLQSGASTAQKKKIEVGEQKKKRIKSDTDSARFSAASMRNQLDQAASLKGEQVAARVKSDDEKDEWFVVKVIHFDKETKEEGLMSPQTETKASVGFKAGVKDYKLTYYTPEYETKDTDILAAFRVTPQLGVPPEEAGAAVAAESSTGTWTTVWTDGLTSLDRYKGRCYHIEPVPGDPDQYICYVAYPLDLFDEWRYEVLDEEPGDDEESTQKKYKLPMSYIIPFPKKGDPSSAPDFGQGRQVLAVYPGTTALYRATVASHRKRKSDDYILEFDDDEEDGSLPQRAVPFYRVVALPEGHRQ